MVFLRRLGVFSGLVEKEQRALLLGEFLLQEEYIGGRFTWHEEVEEVTEEVADSEVIKLRNS